MNSEQILKYVCSEIFNRLVIEPGRYYIIDSWKNIFNYNSLLECVLKNRFKDLFKMMYNNGIIRRDDLYHEGNMEHIYYTDKDLFYELISDRINFIFSVCNIINEKDLEEICNRIGYGSSKFMELIHILIYYYDNTDIMRFVIKNLPYYDIRLGSSSISYILGRGNNFKAVCMFSALRIFCEVVKDAY
ncbi:MAG: hypothetical protein QXD03_02055 [Candidatus Anstonellales archaeon]